MKNKINQGSGPFASARMTNLPISTKQSIEISRYLRYKNTGWAKQLLEEVSALKRAIPFKRFTFDVGHKKGMAAGRYPSKAAKEFLHLLKSVEANAREKGMNLSHLKIVKILANKASIPITGGRSRQGTKRTHLEVVVKEGREDGRKNAVQKGVKPMKPVNIKTEVKANDGSARAEKKKTAEVAVQ